MTPCPVDAILPELIQTLRARSSVVLQAPPGAGKTTRVPLALLDLIPAGKRIVMLQPRRIAAVSSARWMARLLDERVGLTIGYTIRFDRKVSAGTRVEVVTEGILTRRIQSDPAMEDVAMVIFDEFHERSLHADLALALCLDVHRGLREDLKILVMSATLDSGPIAKLLAEAPVIRSEGKPFPVDECYISDNRDRPLTEKVCGAIIRALREQPGDVLVFLPGAREIRACCDALGPVVKGGGGGITVHPLYGDLPFEEQERAIVPLATRKIVLATNIAETSLTIEGIRTVIDSGLTRRLHFDPSTGMNRLVTIPVSRASAEQRKGRAGRLGPGICFRLYSPHTFRSMIPFAPPEILVSDLSPVALELAVWGVRDPSRLSWLDCPPATAWEAAQRLLIDLGALDGSGHVSPLGKAMARLPVHPRLSKLMLRARDMDRPRLGADLAALLSERDVARRGSSFDKSLRGHPEGMTERVEMLQDWRRGVRLHGADPWALRNADRIAQHLGRLVHGPRGISTTEEPDEDVISTLLLAAYPDRIAQLRGEGRFVLVSGRGVRLPSTGGPRESPYIVAVSADIGEGGDGVVHIAAPVSADNIRRECAGRIGTLKQVRVDKKEKRIIATIEEHLGAVTLSSKNFDPGDDEATPLLCDAIRSDPSALLHFTREARQFQGRVALMRRVFPEEKWPDLSDDRLASAPEEWILSRLTGIRSMRDIASIELLPALWEKLTWRQQRLLDERAPSAIVVPSGHRVQLDYAAGDIPVLAVKLQEMFGLGDTPTVAGGRVKVLLHLLSPARRPVQVTQDLRGFWNGGYQDVRKELKGRYPKHPWPDDPWNAPPTRQTKRR